MEGEEVRLSCSRTPTSFPPAGRGDFNQALLLGKVIAAKEGIKILSRTLRRVRRTRPQVELGLKERKENVWQAFAVRDPSPIRGKSILWWTMS